VASTPKKNVKRKELEAVKTEPDELTEEETVKRRDKALKRALNTPPKPHKQSDKPKKTEK